MSTVTPTDLAEDGGCPEFDIFDRAAFDRDDPLAPLRTCRERTATLPTPTREEDR